jgi:phosphatidylglycerophosphate synthase
LDLIEGPTLSTPRAPRRSRWLAALPNGLSLSRLALGLAFPLIPPAWRLAIVLVAGLTDLVDGALSRSLHASTQTGRLLDPVADKVFVAAVALTLLVEGTLQPWEALLLGLRDLTVLAGVLWLVSRGEWSRFRQLPPTLLGKATTAAQFLALLSLLAFQRFSRFLVFLAITFSALAALDYIRNFLGRRHPQSRHGGPPPRVSA